MYRKRIMERNYKCNWHKWNGWMSMYLTKKSVDDLSILETKITVHSLRYTLSTDK